MWDLHSAKRFLDRLAFRTTRSCVLKVTSLINEKKRNFIRSVIVDPRAKILFLLCIHFFPGTEITEVSKFVILFIFRDSR